jgi:hypothetical protein
MHFLKFKSATARRIHPTARLDAQLLKRIPPLARSIWMAFYRRLMTSRLCRKSAIYIILLCTPALALFLSMTVPTWVFQSPDQEAYYYFAKAFTFGLEKGYLLALSVLCMLLTFAMPAAPQDTYMRARY